MKRSGKIIAFSIAVGFVLVVGLIIIASYLMGYNVAERRYRELENRDKKSSALTLSGRQTAICPNPCRN